MAIRKILSAAEADIYVKRGAMHKHTSRRPAVTGDCYAANDAKGS